MSNQTLFITVFGREQICASCVGAPGSEETYEWLRAAIERKYKDIKVMYEYIDMDQIQKKEKHKRMIEKIKEGEMFYPLVVLNDKIIAEGIPHLKTVYEEIDAHII